MGQMDVLKAFLLLSIFLFSIFSESEAKEISPINFIISQINVDLDSLNYFNMDEFGFEDGFMEESKIGTRKRLSSVWDVETTTEMNCEKLSVIGKTEDLNELKFGIEKGFIWQSYDFLNHPELPNELSLRELRNETFQAVLAVLNSQRLGETSSHLYHYEIYKWPLGVSKIKDYWTRECCAEIKSRIKKFVFIPNSEGQVLSPDSWRRREVNELLIDRFNRETGQANLKRINWALLDRSAIPSRYQNLAFDHRTIRLAKVFRNLEIIDNIHFRNPKN